MADAEGPSELHWDGASDLNVRDDLPSMIRHVPYRKVRPLVVVLISPSEASALFPSGHDTSTVQQVFDDISQSTVSRIPEPTLSTSRRYVMTSGVEFWS